MHAGCLDVAAKRDAERIVGDLAEERRPRAEQSRDRARVGDRSAAALDSAGHGGVERPGRLLVDQGHGALAHVVLREERLVGPRYYVDDGVADSNKVETL